MSALRIAAMMLDTIAWIAGAAFLGANDHWFLALVFVAFAALSTPTTTQWKEGA